MALPRTILSLILVLFTFASALSQDKGPYDKIVKKDKTVIECKILRVTEENIEIRPKGPKPFLLIPRSEVDLILYADNTVVKMNDDVKSHSESDTREARPSTSAAKTSGFAWEPLPTIPPGQDKWLAQVGDEELLADERFDKSKGIMPSWDHYMVTRLRYENKEVNLTREVILKYTKDGVEKRVSFQARISFTATTTPIFSKWSGAYIRDLKVHFYLLDLDTNSSSWSSSSVRLADWNKEISENFALPESEYSDYRDRIAKRLFFDTFEYKGRSFSPTISFSNYYEFVSGGSSANNRFSFYVYMWVGIKD